MKFKKIYVLCPGNSITGGPDALHQMVYYLNNIGCDASIVYFDFADSFNFSIPEPYKRYIKDFNVEYDIIDSENNAVVVPEGYIKKSSKIKKSKIFIWWLSVGYEIVNTSFLSKLFYFSVLPLRIIKHLSYYRNLKNLKNLVMPVLAKKSYSFIDEPKQIEHLCASYFAFDYVKCKSQNVINLCIEPISRFFLDCYEKYKHNICDSERTDVILYNPKKTGCSFIKKIEMVAKDLKFEPLQGLSQQQLIDKYKSSKLYIDFGPFPGAERIPKEAVLFGCAIITGRRGASGFYGDVPIPDEYKFEDPKSQVDEIVSKIKYILDNYEKVYSDFDEYRETVLNLENNFIKSLKKIFI